MTPARGAIRGAFGRGEAKASSAFRRRVVVFVKEPAPGRVKTRLGRSLGAHGMISATWWFRHRARRLLSDLARDPRWETWIAVSPDAAARQSRFWPIGVARRPQGGGDLGRRMGRAFAWAEPGPMLILGADIPDVSRARVWAAFQALGTADAVIGPAEDGGYWLIGLKRVPSRRPPRLFEGVRWSTEQARADTEATLADRRIAHVDTLRDVDRASDLSRPIP